MCRGGAALPPHALGALAPEGPGSNALFSRRRAIRVSGLLAHVGRLPTHKQNDKTDHTTHKQQNKPHDGMPPRHENACSAAQPCQCVPVAVEARRGQELGVR
eukprot:235998-Chlamydomonas_euryale.AAC.1